MVKQLRESHQQEHLSPVWRDEEVVDKLPSDRATFGLPTGGTVTEEMEPKTPQEMENGRHTSVYLLVLTSVLSHCLPIGQVYKKLGVRRRKYFLWIKSKAEEGEESIV